MEEPAETAEAEAEMSTLARSSRPAMTSVAGADLLASAVAVSEVSVASAVVRSEEEEPAAAGSSLGDMPRPGDA